MTIDVVFRGKIRRANVISHIEKCTTY